MRDKTQVLDLIARIQAVELEELREQVAQLETDALTDALTGLWNRRYVQQQLRQLSDRRAGPSGRCGSGRREDPPPYAVLMLDLDHFKRVNDTYGHDVGDRVLRAVARVMQDTCRAGDTVARWGGEEFLVLLPHTSRERAEEVAQRLCCNIASASVETDGFSLSVTASVGVSGVSSGSLSAAPEAAVKLADEALYEAKESGRNRVEYRFVESAA